MSLYVDLEYYKNTFKGTTLLDEEAEKYFKLAENKINSITFNRIVARGFENLTSFQQEKIKDAVCYQAEYIKEYGYDTSNNSIASYSVLDISVNVDKTSLTKAEKLNMSGEAYDCIHQTGLDCRING